MKKKKRIFIGVTISNALREEIGKWKEEHITFPVRWTPPENLHITLLPPWYEENVEEISDVLQNMKPCVKPFPVVFEMVAFGPENKRPWLMWARGEMPQEFLLLKKQLTNILQKGEERRHEILHTTLARFSLEQFQQFEEKNFLETIMWKDKISSFSLIESHLRRTGAVYETLTTINL